MTTSKTNVQINRLILYSDNNIVQAFVSIYASVFQITSSLKFPSSFHEFFAESLEQIPCGIFESRSRRMPP